MPAGKVQRVRAYKKNNHVIRMATVNMMAPPGALKVTNGERDWAFLRTRHARQEMSACRQGAGNARLQKKPSRRVQPGKKATRAGGERTRSTWQREAALATRLQKMCGRTTGDDGWQI